MKRMRHYKKFSGSGEEGTWKSGAYMAGEEDRGQMALWAMLSSFIFIKRAVVKPWKV